MDLLPTEFDVIVVGTGVVESTISAAASRIGKRVLQIDNRSYYGGLWASFNIESIQKLIEPGQDEPSGNTDNLSAGEVPVGNSLFQLQHASQTWHIPCPDNTCSEVPQDIFKPATCSDEKQETQEKDETKEVWTKERMIKEARRFNIDLAPKLQFARGDFVELLISSNIARYSEFRSVTRVLTWLDDQLDVVPCSRSDIFSNSKVTVIDKRMLMKLLTTCMDSDETEFADYKDKSFKTYLTDRKLSYVLVRHILYAIAMCNMDTSCLKGVQNTKRFLSSLGRFGKTPFLYSLYGSGEIPQAFCRMSAVFGGVFALNQPLKSYCLDENGRFIGVNCGDQKITADYLVVGVEYAPESFVKNIETGYISRGIFITDGSILESEQEQLTLLIYPSRDDSTICYIIEAGSSTGTCPKGMHIVYMFTKQVKTPKEDLDLYVYNLFKTELNEEHKPNVLWSCFYSTPDTQDLDLQANAPDNVFLCPGPDVDLDYDNSIRKAKEIFKQMYPDLEFLPRAPDPEDIIFGDDSDENAEVASDIVTENHQEVLAEKEMKNLSEEKEDDLSEVTEAAKKMTV